jgi:hypothetical protein
VTDFERLDDLTGQMDMLITGLLTGRGWRHTSSTPDSVWRWVKTLPDGTKIMTTQRDALNIERAATPE